MFYVLIDSAHIMITFFSSSRFIISRFQSGTFEWDRQMRGYILSSFFYGYIVTQIPGGWLAGYYGGKRVFAAGMLATAIATLLVPVAAYTHYSLVLVLRVVMGLGTVSLNKRRPVTTSRMTPRFE